MKALLLALGALLAGCVAQSLPGERFSQSQLLAEPINSVTVADPDAFSFSIVGDLHFNGGDVGLWEKILDESQAAGDAFCLVLGDIADQGAESDFIAYKNVAQTKGWSGKLFSVIGNHDIFFNGWEHFSTHVGPSHYTFQVGNSKFVVFDTADGMVGKTQMDWLERQMKTKPKHLFLASHYMPLIPGITTYLKLANQDEAALIMKWANRYGASAWMGAHYHSYIKTNIEGTDYIVAGGGGGRRMAPEMSNFWVRVSVAGEALSYELKRLN